MARLIDIEGIGKHFAGTLEAAGLTTTEALLEAAGSAAGRRALAQKSGIDASRLLEFVNRADLMRVNGIGPQFSDLLEEAGVDTVKELATRNPTNLHAKLAEVNSSKNLVNRLPGLGEVEAMVAHAKTLPGAVSY